MTDIAIKVENLTKEFQIGQERSGDFRESFGNTLKTMLGAKATKETFTALDDISFEVKKGEALGIIGRNGAGKSTLLKILSRITEPTKGRIEIHGRVSALLEVGTGFHPELTGRENIYLNGTILGMSRREVKSKFDEIVEFSSVEKFIDTPVKHYSSGMKVRLAFSVAAHLEPEILIIDEVLAVGDAEFQKKCLGKMEDVSKQEGRTVVFVSHNMGAVSALCSKGILMENGSSHLFQKIEDAILHYTSNCSEDYGSSGVWRFDSGPITKITLMSNQRITSKIMSASTFTMECEFKTEFLLKDIVFGIAIKSSDGRIITSINNRHLGSTINRIPVDKGIVKLTIPELVLYKNDSYILDVFFGDQNEDIQELKDIIQFEVLPADVYNNPKQMTQFKNLIYHKDLMISLSDE